MMSFVALEHGPYVTSQICLAAPASSSRLSSFLSSSSFFLFMSLPILPLSSSSFLKVVEADFSQFDCSKYRDSGDEFLQ